MRYFILSYFLLLLGLQATATQFHVGSNQTYTHIQDVPWASLLPGDQVFIHAQAQPYTEKLVLSASGTAAQPIQIIGVKDNNGNKPVIEGDGAQSLSGDYLGAGQSFSLNTRGLITIAPRPGYSYGYKPSYITIENLTIKNAHPSKTFYENGIPMNYNDFCAGIYADRCEHIQIKKCTIYDCAMGIFINSKGDEATQSRHILIEGNHIYNAGVVNSFLEHTTYIEAIDVIYQYNTYGPLIPGALGGALKDRSAGTIIRYNKIESGMRTLDLVNAQNSAPIATIDPSYKETYVYGNLLLNNPIGSSNMIHYGGDDYNYMNYRRGNLYFYNNTVINTANQSTRYYTVLFDLPDDPETISNSINYPIEEKIFCDNNIFYSRPEQSNVTASYFIFSNADSPAVITLHKNWVSPGSVQHYNYSGFTDSCTGWSQVYISNSNAPGFINEAQLDFGLQLGGECVDAGAPLPSNYLPIQHEYSTPDTFIVRNLQGNTIDLGFAEYKLNIPLDQDNYLFNVVLLHENLAQIEWKNYADQRFEHIEVEHATDDLHFEPITHATATQQFKHIYPLQSFGKHYFKIKMKRTDDAIQYTETICLPYEKQYSMSIYPNPCADVVTVSYEKNVENITLWNMYGEVLHTWYPNSTTSFYNIPLQAYPAGNYILQVSCTDEPTYQTLLIKK